MKFALTLTITFLLVFLVYPAANYVLDKYAVFQTPGQEGVLIFNEPNKIFLKTDYILKNKDKFDSFIFGSSRVGFIDATRIPGGKWYNMTYSEGLPKEHLEILKLFLKTGVKIKNVLIGLDDFSYQISPDKHQDEPLRISHYQTSLNHRNWLSHYWYYLFLKIKWVDFVRYRGRDWLDIYTTGGHPPDPERERLIDGDLEKHRADPKFFKLSHEYDPVDREKETIDEIAEIIRLCKKNRINLVFFINPIHHYAYECLNIADFLDFKRKMAGTTDYWDFSGLNSITLDNGRYYETSHYRRGVGDMIISRIFGDGSGVPRDFGLLVNKDNFPEHRRRLIRELDEFGESVYPCDECAASKGHELANLEAFLSVQNEGHKIDFVYENGEIKAEAHTGDPVLIFDRYPDAHGQACLCADFDCPEATRFQLFFRRNPNDDYSEENSYIKQLYPGRNKFCLAIPARYVQYGLRIDPVSDEGNFTIHDFVLKDDFQDFKRRLLRKMDEYDAKIYPCDECGALSGHEFVNLEDLLSVQNIGHRIDFIYENGEIKAEAHTGDPVLIFDHYPDAHGQACLCADFDCPEATFFQLFFRLKPNGRYSEENSYVKQLHSGRNKFCLVFPARYVHFGLRIDPVSDDGNFTIHDFVLKGIYN